MKVRRPHSVQKKVLVSLPLKMIVLPLPSDAQPVIAYWLKTLDVHWHTYQKLYIKLVHWKEAPYCHVVCMCDYRRGLDWRMDLLTTYTLDFELQAITAPLLISIVHKSPQQSLSLFHTGSGFWRWKFFSFTHSGSLVTDSHAQLCQLTLSPGTDHVGDSLCCLAMGLYATIHNKNIQKQMMQMNKKQCTIISLHLQLTRIWGDHARSKWQRCSSSRDKVARMCSWPHSFT
jgi:hypothetical protein